MEAYDYTLINEALLVDQKSASSDTLLTMTAFKQCETFPLKCLYHYGTKITVHVSLGGLILKSVREKKLTKPSVQMTNCFLSTHLNFIAKYECALR